MSNPSSKTISKAKMVKSEDYYIALVKAVDMENARYAKEMAQIQSNNDRNQADIRREFRGKYGIPNFIQKG